MQLLLITLTNLVVAAFFLVGKSVAYDGWAAFYPEGNCGGTAVYGNYPQDWACQDCLAFPGGAAVSAGLWGSMGESTSCSVYATSDCTGPYQSVGSSGENKESCTELRATSYSARCYFLC